MFDQSCKMLARSLKGHTLVIGDKKAEILTAQGYAKRQNEGHPYTPVLEMKPGEFFCPQHRGSQLLLIACPDNGKPGGCVLIRKVKIGDEVFDGPGRVCKALGFEDPVRKGKITPRGTDLVLCVTV